MPSYSYFLFNFSFRWSFLAFLRKLHDERESRKKIVKKKEKVKGVFFNEIPLIPMAKNVKEKTEECWDQVQILDVLFSN